jgi:hypothetical protein
LSTWVAACPIVKPPGFNLMAENDLSQQPDNRMLSRFNIMKLFKIFDRLEKAAH